MDIGVNYTAHHGPWTCRDGIKQIFYCRRSGMTSSAKTSKIRAEKSQGTCKMGSYCTSSMEVLKTDAGKIDVTLYADHHDHDLNFTSLVHMKLPKSEKDKIAGMIVQGIDQDRILDQVREGSEGQRLCLLDKKDLQNIATEFGINFKRKTFKPAKQKVRTQEIELLQNSVCKETNNDSLVENMVNQVECTISDFLPKLRNIRDVKILKSLHSQMSKAAAIIDAANNFSVGSNPLPVDQSTSTESVIKHIIMQEKFYSTRKKKKLNDETSLKIPSRNIKKKIGKILSEAHLSTSVLPTISNGDIKDEQDYCV